MTLDAQITDLERRRAELVGQLASVGQMRPGSLTLRFRRCGTAGCHCAKPGDPGHGGGREPGCPGPPAQIRTCALAHTAPTLGG